MPLLESNAWGTNQVPEAKPEATKPKESSSFSDTLGAVNVQENIWRMPLSVRALEYPMDRNFDYKQYPKEYWGFVAGARNADHANMLIKQFQKEQEARKIIENASFVTGLGANVLVGLKNPLNFIGFGGASTVGRAVLKAGAGAAAGTAATEPLLHSQQLTRTWEESAFNVAGAFGVGGVLGGGGKMISNKLKNGGFLANEAPAIPSIEPQKLFEGQSGPFQPGSVGAAQHTPLSADGSKIAGTGWMPKPLADKITRFTLGDLIPGQELLGDISRSANQRLSTSRFAASRDFVHATVKTSLATNDQLEGIAKAVPVEIAQRQRIAEMGTKLAIADNEARGAWWKKVENGDYDEAEILKTVKELLPGSTGPDYKVNRTTFDLLVQAHMNGFDHFAGMEEVVKRAKFVKDTFDDLTKEQIDNFVFKKHQLMDLTTGERIKDPTEGMTAAMLKELRKQQDELQAERAALRELKKKNGAHTPEEVSKLKELDDKIAGHEKAIADKKAELDAEIKKFDDIAPDSSIHGLAYEDGAYYLSRMFDKSRLIGDGKGFKNALMQGWIARNPDLDPTIRPEVLTELNKAAQQVLDTLLQRENINTLGEIKDFMRTNFDALASFTKDRTLNIDDKFLIDYMHHDVTATQMYYLDKAILDVELAKRGFSYNDAKYALELEADKLKEAVIAEHGANTRKANKLIAEIENEMKKDLDEMKYIMRQLKRQGPEGDDGMTAKGLKDWVGRVNKLSGMAQLGSSAVPNSLGDTASAAVHNGAARTYKIIGKFFSSPEARADMLKHGKESGVLAELVNKHMREAYMGDIAAESLNPNKGFKSPALTAFDRGLDWTADKFAQVSFIDAWSKAGRVAARTAADNRLLDAAEKGWKNLSKFEQTELAKFYIDEPMLERIAEQYKAHGSNVDGVKFSEPNSWADKEAAARYKQSVYALTEYSLNIPSIGTGSKFISENPLGRLLMRYKSFNNASHESTFLASLQDRNATRLMTGAMNWMFWGFVSTYAYDSFKQGKLPDLDDYFGSPEKIHKTFWKSITKSGYFAAASDAAVAGLKAVGSIKGPIGDTVHKVIPKGIEDEIFPKYKEVSFLEKVGGPTWGYASKAGDAVTGLLDTSNGVSEKDVHTIRTLLPGQNIFWLRRALDYVEESLGGYKADRPPK